MQSSSPSVPRRTHPTQEEVIQLLRLVKCADTAVGGGMARGVSGGERKRLCIAIEMLLQPRVLLMDEPTSGLDSRIAQLVVEAMQDLAQNHQLTVVATIHQPSSKVFHMFDQLCVVEEGVCLYFGPTRGAVAVFGKAGYPCPFSYNPADYIMDLLVIRKLSDEAQELLRNTATQGGDHMTPDLLAALETSSQRETDSGPMYSATFWERMSVLMSRAYKLEKSNITAIENIIMYIGVTIIPAMLWVPTRNDFTEESLANRMALVFLILGTWLWFPLYNNIMTLRKEYVNISKELSAGAYPLSSFYLARTTAQIPIDLMWTIFNVPMMYFLGNVNPNAGTFFAFFFWVWIQVMVQESIGLFIGASASGLKAITFALLAMTFMFSAGGLFVRLDQFGWLAFLKYLNPLVYAFEGGMSIAFNDQIMYACDQQSALAVCIDFVTGNTTEQNLISGADVLHYYGVTISIRDCFIAMIIVMLLFRVLGYCALYVAFVNSGTLSYPCCPHGCCKSAPPPPTARKTVQESKDRVDTVIDMNDAIQDHDRKVKVYNNHQCSLYIHGLPPLADTTSSSTNVSASSSNAESTEL